VPNAAADHLFTSALINNKPHYWQCDRVWLSNGTYDGIEIIADQLTNEYSYMAIDQIGIVDPRRGTSMCRREDK